jgi:hypothetical protein
LTEKCYSLGNLKPQGSKIQVSVLNGTFNQRGKKFASLQFRYRQLFLYYKKNRSRRPVDPTAQRGKEKLHSETYVRTCCTAEHIKHTPWNKSGDKHTPWNKSGDKHTPWNKSGDKHTPWNKSGDKHTPWNKSGDKHTPWNKSGDKHTP